MVVTLASASRVTGALGEHPDPDTPTVPPGATELRSSTSDPPSACWLPPDGSDGLLAGGVVGATGADDDGVGVGAAGVFAGVAGVVDAAFGAVDALGVELCPVDGCV
ncbi:MAG TPA: hypothetical protein VKY26_10510, partial [Actinomycetota bacterium]|nr:hypothetical protein [Actinomycetota bacterium]